MRPVVGPFMIKVDGTQLFIPTAAREEVLEQLHASHMGITKMYGVACVNYYWLSMDRLICFSTRELNISISWISSVILSGQGDSL